MVKSIIYQGDIWLIKLDPTQGSEIKKTRPCLVISPPELNNNLRTILVAPMTTRAKEADFRISFTHAGEKGLVLFDQIRTIDKSRLVKKLGKLPPKTLYASLTILQTIFGHQ
ncbi:mRNA interferase MazF [Polynucleobacter brandtiae]|uniref:mRNA interferase n=1 Tax=Polynucleobacter brandtiae TaxID=1938816 RepID=A0A2M8VIP1_9BURK|nr:mRNA interferase MazF [Polynucleobacter brandtiae]